MDHPTSAIKRPGCVLLGYTVLLLGLAYVFFGHLLGHPFDIDDDFYLSDSEAIRQNIGVLFSPEKAFSGRPCAEAIFLILSFRANMPTGISSLPTGQVYLRHPGCQIL